MTLIDRFGTDLPRTPVTVELSDIQATVLRYRPEPYYGTHVMLQVTDAQAGRDFVRRLIPHVDSAADWWQAGAPWISVAFSYTGLAALGVPLDSLRSFPDAFRAGMAARAGQLGDYGENHPGHWDQPFRGGLIHIGVSVFSESELAWRRTMEMARQQYAGFPGLTVLEEQDFGAQPGDLNPLGYKDSIGQPAVEGSGVDPLPGQGPPVKAGEFILGYPGEAGVPLPMPTPEVLGRNGTYAGLRKYQSRVAAFNRFLREHAQTEQERELLAAKLIGRWRSGAPLTLRPDRRTTRNLARTRTGTTTSAMPPTRRGELMPLRLPRAADEPARHQAGHPHRRQRAPHHPAQHDIRGGRTTPTRSPRRTTRPRTGSTASSSAARPWPPWSSCSRSGSTTATS